MAMIRIMIKDGQKPTKEQIREINAAAKMPINYTADCPESTCDALAEFAKKAKDLRRGRPRWLRALERDQVSARS
ncbi:MAG: hypothetical protein LBK61_08385 [Spirochaetaceae bacterium]|jgi:hypothetical protein|nr:hypothetical protein [Spirochaetaceae bacterium]